MRMPRSFVSFRQILLALLPVVLSTDADAAFERALFPLSPLDTVAQLTSGPAGLGEVRRPCGSISHDRPFGLSALSGHRLLLATPLPWGLAVGAGGAMRGPPRHREYGGWMGIGTRFTASLALGVTIQGLAWRGPAGIGERTIAGAAGWQLDLPASWSLAGWIRPAQGHVPARVWLQLTRRDAQGAVAVGLSARSGRGTIPVLSMATQLSRRLSLTGQVLSLARAFGAGGTVQASPLSLHVHVVTHPVLGPSSAGWVGRTCR